MTSPTERHRPTVSKAIAAYRRAGSLRKAAKLLGVSHTTVHTVLKDQRQLLRPPGGGFRKGHYMPEVHTSAVAEWFRRHSFAVMPRSPKQIAFVIGCSSESVRCYLYRRRKFERKRLVALLNGWRPNLRDAFKIDPYTFKITFEVPSPINHKAVRWTTTFRDLKAQKENPHVDESTGRHS